MSSGDSRRYVTLPHRDHLQGAFRVQGKVPTDRKDHLQGVHDISQDGPLLSATSNPMISCFPITEVFNNRDDAGRTAKWVMELGILPRLHPTHDH
jgi:hypothetical protein